MLLKLLGAADILTLISLLLISYLPKTLVIVMALYLIVKGIIFTLMGDIVSLIDALSGFYIITASYGLAHWSITLIITLIILQKSIVSIFS